MAAIEIFNFRKTFSERITQVNHEKIFPILNLILDRELAQIIVVNHYHWMIFPPSVINPDSQIQIFNCLIFKLTIIRGRVSCSILLSYILIHSYSEQHKIKILICYVTHLMAAFTEYLSRKPDIQSQ